MNSSEHNPHWPGRIIGAIAVAGAAFLGLCFWDTWGLGVPVRIAVSVTLGILFLIFGGSVWRWVSEIDIWS